MGGKGSGPRPRPSAVRGLFGGAPVKVSEQAPVIEPAPESFDEPPVELHGDAEAILEWLRTVPTLRSIGLVSKLERASLITLCRCWSRLMAAEHAVLRDGAVIQGESGPRVHPAVKVADTAIAQCIKLWNELGMTPSGRAKMVAMVKREAPVVSKWAGVV